MKDDIRSTMQYVLVTAPLRGMLALPLGALASHEKSVNAAAPAKREVLGVPAPRDKKPGSPVRRRPVRPRSGRGGSR